MKAKRHTTRAPQLGKRGGALFVTIRHTFDVTCVRDGIVVWREKKENLVTLAGRQLYLTSGIMGTSWFIGFKATGAAQVTDTLSAHPGWAEVLPVESRPAWNPGSPADGAVDNSGSPATFAVTNPGRLAGVFMCSVAEGSSGTLLGVANFADEQDVALNDQISVVVGCTVGGGT